MTQWSIDDARALYNIQQWSEGYFDIDPQGRIQVQPSAKHQPLALTEIIDAVHQRGLRAPFLVRFGDILAQQVQRLTAAFAQARASHQYQGDYTSVYPIKVNQTRHVVEAILASEAVVGLEAGSKPELLAVLALADVGDTVICNGYKDHEFIRLALMGKQLGRDVRIVIEKLSELPLVLSLAKQMQVTPVLGVRVRLASVGKGKWQNTGGEKSKFGLSAAQVLRLIEELQQQQCLSWLQLLHFHLGSQIANIHDIQRGMRECARFYVELRRLGAPIDTVDVGGGLGVDYEGTASRSFCSMNYSMQEYANNVVHALAEACEQADLPQPGIITESGRAMTAHHAVLITNIVDIEQTQPDDTLPPPAEDDAPVLHELQRCYQRLTERTALEVFHDTVHYIQEAQALYLHGVLSLQQRALAERWYALICQQVRQCLNPSARAHREVLDELNEKWADKYILNLSIFQSVPDVWGIDQIFPVLPLQYLDQPATQRAVLQDITCDSDGRIDLYVDGHGVETSLPLPDMRQQSERWIGIFMVGAYQEILGDMHNLFGDTASALVQIAEDGQFSLHELSTGDTVDTMLRYVSYDTQQLLDRYQQQLAQSQLSTEIQQEYFAVLQEGLLGYTYLEED